MSERYDALQILLEEVRKVCLTLVPDRILADIVDDGRPTSPIQDGQFFVGIHTSMGRSVQPADSYLDWLLSFRITVSWKTSSTQRQRVGDVELLTNGGMLWPVWIASKLAGPNSRTYLTAAQARLGPKDSLNPGHYARMLRCSAPQEQYGEWFGAGEMAKRATDTQRIRVPQGMSIDAEIGNVRYIRFD